MSNTIELAKSFVPKLDECYRLASLTSVLDGAPELAKQGANANELIIPMMSMDGLADYSRNGGYVQGGVTMTNETVKCNFDRGRRFDVDVMDDLETAGLAFGRLSAQFIRDKVVPELDAFRFASYCGISGVTKKEETLADGAATVAALSAAVTAMDDEEVTATGRYLFITPTLLQGINDMDTTKSKKVLEGFEQVIKVPQRRFYTAIKQLSGKTGEEAGGYTKAAGAANINFAIVQKDALIQYTKHAAPKIIAPENNPDADAYVFGYRIYDLCRQTVTVYHACYNPFRVTRCVIHGAYFERKTVQTVDKSGGKSCDEFLLVIPNKNARRVAPALFNGIPGVYVLECGDRIVEGVGEEITTREQWGSFVPANRPGVVTADWVRDMGCRNVLYHVEAGGKQ